MSSNTNAPSRSELQGDNAHNTSNQQARAQDQYQHGKEDPVEGSTQPTVQPTVSHAAEIRLHVEVTILRARYDCCSTRLSAFRGQWEDLSARVTQPGRSPTGHQLMETTTALLAANRQLVADFMTLKGDAEVLLAKLETGYGRTLDGRKPAWYDEAVVALRRAVNVREMCGLLELVNLVTAGPLQTSVRKVYGLGG